MINHSPKNFGAKFKQRKGFTMPEVMMAILILTAGSIASISILIYTHSVAVLSNNHLIATNLSREGLEIVRNLRDSNWLNYSGNLREHWNDGFNASDIGEPFDNVTTPLNPREIGYFIADINKDSLDPATDRWSLLSFFDTATYPELDFDLNPDNTDLDSKSLDAYRLCTKDGFYFHDPACGDDAGEEYSNFYRQIQITYLDTDGDGFGTPADNIAEINAVVVWRHRTADYRRVIISTKLSDWLQRNDHN